MKDAIKVTSACYARKPIDGDHKLREMPLCGKLNIRGNATDSKFAGAIKDTLELDLPVKPNSVSERDGRRLFWLGPDEWLLHCDLNDTESLQQRLRKTFGNIHFAVTDVSDYYMVLRLQSGQAESLIRNGCPLDIHHSVFQEGDMAQTRFGHASILLYRLNDGGSWDIQVRWTYAEYVWDYLASAMETVAVPK